MKVTITNITKRIELRENRQKGILDFDIDNAYPQRIIHIVNASATGTATVNLFAKFIAGRGFKDEQFFKSSVNRKNLSVDKLLKKLSRDYARFNGFAVHVNYNALFQIQEINYLPFDYCRLTNKESDHYGKIAVYDDWAMQQYNKRFDINNVDYIKRYNPDPAVIQKQVLDAGGWEKYKGQVYWFSIEGDTYPLSPFDSVLEDIQTDSQLKLFKFRNVTTNFLASHMLITDKIEKAGINETDSDISKIEDDFRKSLEEYQGADDALKIIWVQKQHPDQQIELKKIDIQDVDKLYEYTERSIKDNIIQAFQQPPVLLGVHVAGKLGTSKEIQEATEFYNSITEPERLVFEEVFRMLFSRFANKLINPTNDFSILPLQVVDADKQTLGDSATNAVITILNSSLSDNQKINTISTLFGISKDEATLMVTK